VRHDPRRSDGVKRIGRYILHALTALSLLLCLAISGLWLRGYWIADSMARVTENGWLAGDGTVSDSQFVLHLHMWTSARGALQFRNFRTEMDGPMTWIFSTPFDRKPALSVGWHRSSADAAATAANLTTPRTFGFGHERKHVEQELSLGETRAGFPRQPGIPWVIQDEHVVVVPHWLPLILTAIAPASRCRAWLRNRTQRRQRGRCAKCGYDLRATPQRCPECGAIPGGAKA
jgi:4-amino-4-deoxy-L-arabinose transferase-like glycosyltransferase